MDAEGSSPASCCSDISWHAYANKQVCMQRAALALSRSSHHVEEFGEAISCEFGAHTAFPGCQSAELVQPTAAASESETCHQALQML